MNLSAGAALAIRATQFVTIIATLAPYLSNRLGPRLRRVFSVCCVTLVGSVFEGLASYASVHSASQYGVAAELSVATALLLAVIGINWLFRRWLRRRTKPRQP